MIQYLIIYFHSQQMNSDSFRNSQSADLAAIMQISSYLSIRARRCLKVWKGDFEDNCVLNEQAIQRPDGLHWGWLLAYLEAPNDSSRWEGARESPTTVCACVSGQSKHMSTCLHNMLPVSWFAYMSERLFLHVCQRVCVCCGVQAHVSLRFCLCAGLSSQARLADLLRSTPTGSLAANPCSHTL